MGKDHTTVLGIALAAIVAVVMTEGLFSLWDVMIGVVCLTIMVTISHSTERTGSIAWGSLLSKSLLSKLAGRSRDGC